MVLSGTTVTIDLGSQASLDKVGESQVAIAGDLGDNVATSPEDDKKESGEKNGKSDTNFHYQFDKNKYLYISCAVK